MDFSLSSFVADNYIEQLFYVIQVAAATILAGIVGLERELYNKPAGFRTHMLVGGSSALLVILGEVMVTYFSDIEAVSNHLRTDPVRIIEAIIVGVSFIGAGTVLKVEKEERVRYLTTAASILFSAGIGIAVALRQLIFAGCLVFVVVAINFLMARISSSISD